MSTFAPLFNRRALRQAIEATPEPTPAQTAAAARWARTVRAPSFLKENEKPHQGAFLADLFGTVLGYGQLADAGGDGVYHLVAEAASSETKGGTTPDAQLGFFGGAGAVTRGVVELKAPVADLDARQNRTGDKRTPVEQGFGYVPKFDGCRWVVVSNYRVVRLYRTTRGEGYAWSVDVGRLDEPDMLREALAVLGRGRLLGSFAGASPTEALAERSERDERALADGFYRFYRDTRVGLFRALLEANPVPRGNAVADHERDLLAAAQTVLDRLLFVCFAEDTGLLPEDVLTAALDQAGQGFVQTSRWDQLQGLFQAIDRGRPELGVTGYNGGLFAPDAVVDGLAVPDAALDFARTLSGYDFSEELGVEVLGRVFERSIADLEALHAEIDGTDDQARSKRSQEGVFYTPGWVTRFVADQALGGWLRARYEAVRAAHGVDAVPESFRKKRREAEVAFWRAYQDELRGVKVLDPACGSGAFLVAAFNALLAEYKRANRALAELEGGQAGLFDPDREILRENLYGVDVNGESVEITRLSLWLKTARRGQPLTALDATIRAGDSLVAPPDAAASDADRATFGALDGAARARAFDWRVAFPEVFEAGARGRSGFNVVLGNPPYVRGEWLDAGLKRVLGERYAVYAGKADLLSYFYERSLGVMAGGGRLGFIVSNKWLKAGYGEPLRRYLAAEAETEVLVDFGHSPVFEDADTFPVITVLRKPTDGETRGDVRLARVPRESLGAAGLAQLVADEAFAVAPERFGAGEWSLEPPETQALLDRLYADFPTFGDSVGKSLSGIKTGYNPAFIVDRATRDRLVSEDPRSTEVLRQYAQGTEIARWAAPADGKFLLALASSANAKWPWTGAEDPELVFAETYPAVHRYMTEDVKPDENRRQRLIDRGDQGEHWWELRSCGYYNLFDAPKLLFTDLAWWPEVGVDQTGLYLNNSAYFVPTGDPWAAAVLNSPVAWWIAWRTFQHGKDEALRWFKASVDALPYPAPDDRQRAEAERAVGALVRLAEAERDGRRDAVLWLRVEHGVESPGRTLDDPAGMEADAFLEGVRKKGASRRLSPAAVGALSRAHGEMRAAREARRAEALPLERALAAAVEGAYGLSEAERELVRRTAPPRTPLYAPDGRP